MVQANEARNFLDSCEVMGHYLKVVPSRAEEIRDSRAKDYFNTEYHRYRGNDGPRYTQNLVAPSQHLRVTDIPAGSTEQDMLQLYTQVGDG